MAKRGKRYQAAAAKIDAEKQYSPSEPKTTTRCLPSVAGVADA